MDRLKGFQKRYLRGVAHGLKPLVYVGQKGFTPSLADAVDEALDRHELVKVKFVEFKEKEMKLNLVARIAQAASCETVGLVGHTAIFYRQQADPEKRRITLPRGADG